jgi:putative component of membrane protein insertase Oxa1/YidC/SpoIIIJ protein YidD
MKKALILFFTLLTFQQVYAQQQSSDMAAITAHIQNDEALKNSNEKKVVHMKLSYNPIKLILFVPLYLYQKLVSEQVSAVCEFEPSCSNFGIQSIAKLGFIKGLFLTADRLTRCNGEAQPESKYYLIDHYSGKVIDEPGMYKFRD